MKTKIPEPKKPINSKYDPLFIGVAQRLLERGVTNKEVYSLLGVTEQTGIRWRKDYPEFDEVFKTHQTNLVGLIENQLVKECLGYYYEEIEKTPIYDKKTGANTKKFKISKITRKKARSNYSAIAFALTNLAPDKWKNRKDLDLTTSLQHPALQSPDNRHKQLLDLGLSEDQLSTMYKQYQKKLEKESATDAQLVDNSIGNKEIENGE